jgi:hypothetical protein
MSVTIGALTLSSLKAQPLVYNAVDTRAGNTVRSWEIQGILTGSEWITLLGIYDTWRNAKIIEENPISSKALGTTVSFSGNGYGSQTWNNVPCWFDSPPEGSQVASMVSVSFTLVDAAQAIESYYKEEEDQRDDESDIDYGTITLGGVVITLKSYPNVYLQEPTLELTAGGKHYVTGPNAVVEGVEINGEIVGTNINALRSWYRTTAQSNPVVGQYFPISSPRFNGFERIVAGSPVLYYEVTMTLAVVL